MTAATHTLISKPQQTDQSLASLPSTLS